MESVFYIELFYNNCKQEWCAVSYFSAFQGISPLISSSEKSFSSLFSMTPSLCRLREAPSHLSCDTVFPIPCCRARSLLPPTKKIEGFARDDDTRRMRFPHTLSLHDARDIHSLHCHFERSREILLALCSSLPLSRKASNFTLSYIRRYTGVQERSRASLGMTLRKWRFPNISVVRYVK